MFAVRSYASQCLSYFPCYLSVNKSNKGTSLVYETLNNAINVWILNVNLYKKKKSYFEVISTEVYSPYEGKNSCGSHFWLADVNCSNLYYFGLGGRDGRDGTAPFWFRRKCMLFMRKGRPPVAIMSLNMKVVLHWTNGHEQKRIRVIEDEDNNNDHNNNNNYNREPNSDFYN